MVHHTCKFLGVVGISGVLLVGIAAPSQSYNYWPHNYHLTYGVSGQKYWIGPDAEAFIEDGIVEGVNAWNSASGKVSYARTTTQSSSRMDFTHPTTANNTCANTLFFVDTTNVQDSQGYPTSNYWWGKVQVRNIIKNATACGPGHHRSGIIAHEVGHVFGLAHVEGGAPRIMQRTIAFEDYWDVDTPRADDVAGVDNLY